MPIKIFVKREGDMNMRHHRISIGKSVGLIALLCISSVVLPSQVGRPTRALNDTTDYTGWTQGYTLVLLEKNDIHSVDEARDFITSEGGTIAVYSDARIMLGWVPLESAQKIVGKHGIQSVFYGPANLGPTAGQDDVDMSFLRFFNSVVSGETGRQFHSVQTPGLPLINDARPHPKVVPENMVCNLKDKSISWDYEWAETVAAGGIFPGYSNFLSGKIAYCLFFIESNGTIDADSYTWTTSARDQVINQCMVGASWWAHEAKAHNEAASFYVYYYSPDSSLMKQGYEPILHSSGEDNLWIDQVMSNLGYSTGNQFDRTTSFNAWLKNHAQSDWAYSCFIAYNPPGAPTTFTDGHFAYAYLGGPYVQMLYRNDGWSINDTWRNFAHETGHIF
jgi:hypothetical protein